MLPQNFSEDGISVPVQMPITRRRWVIGFVATTLFNLLASPLSASEAPLCFSLKRFEDSSGDFPLVFYTFRCGTKLYTFCPPAAWKVSSDVMSMVLSASNDGSGAVARFRISSPAELALLNPDRKGQRELELRRNLPAGYSELRRVGVENTDPLPVFSHNAVEIVYNYQFYGRSLSASVIVCKLDENNGFTLVTTAPAETWDGFIAQLRRTLGATGIVEDRFFPGIGQPDQSSLD